MKDRIVTTEEIKNSFDRLNQAAKEFYEFRNIDILDNDFLGDFWSSLDCVIGDLDYVGRLLDK